MGIWSSPNGGAVCDPIGKMVRLETFTVNRCTRSGSRERDLTRRHIAPSRLHVMRAAAHHYPAGYST